jgi:hypothetical protein
MIIANPDCPGKKKLAGKICPVYLATVTFGYRRMAVWLARPKPGRPVYG